MKLFVPNFVYFKLNFFYPLLPLKLVKIRFYIIRVENNFETYHRHILNYCFLLQQERKVQTVTSYQNHASVTNIHI